MILLLRALVRLLGFLLLIALALVGLGFALAALFGDQLGVQLEGSAVSRWLERLEGDGTQVTRGRHRRRHGPARAAAVDRGAGAAP